jgi:hypothetical protein
VQGEALGDDGSLCDPQRVVAAGFLDGGDVTPRARRLILAGERDPDNAALLCRLLRLSFRALPQAQVHGEFAFTMSGTRKPGGGWQLRPSGVSARYGAITALGLLRLPEKDQRDLLAGDTAVDLVGRLTKRLDEESDRGDVALLCWAAAEAEHSELPHALQRLADVDRRDGPVDTVAAAWVVAAIVAARRHADVEQHLGAARDRLMAARSAAYPHVIGGTSSWYRSHVGSFADQVYPIQALARLHSSADDPRALAAADAVASAIRRAQGDAGQWWWHYDARTGEVIEGYPVYSVHQHAMAPMALLDLADAGGQDHLDAICRGLRWLARPPETSEELVLDEPPVAWRKVARGDRRKVVRGLRAASTRLRPGTRLPLLDRAFRPGWIDHECRPYELGWLLLAWLT